MKEETDECSVYRSKQQKSITLFYLICGVFLEGLCDTNINYLPTESLARVILIRIIRWYYQITGGNSGGPSQKLRVRMAQEML